MNGEPESFGDLPDERKKELLRLSQAILNSLANSKEVHDALGDALRKKNTDWSAPVVILIEMRQLKDVVEGVPEEVFANYFLEGIRINREEEAFLDYCNESFNDDDWLSGLRLTLDSEEPE